MKTKSPDKPQYLAGIDCVLVIFSLGFSLSLFALNSDHFRFRSIFKASQSSLQTLNSLDHPPHIFSLRLTVLGAKSVGKSSLINYLTFNEYKATTPTIGFDHSSLSFYKSPKSLKRTYLSFSASFSKKVIQLNKQSWVQYYVWEVSGLEKVSFNILLPPFPSTSIYLMDFCIKYRSIAPLYYRDAHAVVLVYDMSVPDSLKRCKEWYTEVQISRPNVPIILLGTKRDLVSELSLSLDDVNLFVKNSGFFFSIYFVGSNH